jgi:hypothetical protein
MFPLRVPQICPKRRYLDLNPDEFLDREKSIFEKDDQFKPYAKPIRRLQVIKGIPPCFLIYLMPFVKYFSAHLSAAPHWIKNGRALFVDTYAATLYTRTL